MDDQQTAAPEQGAVNEATSETEAAAALETIDELMGESAAQPAAEA